jgi:hypothetical protein
MGNTQWVQGWEDVRHLESRAVESGHDTRADNKPIAVPVGEIHAVQAARLDGPPWETACGRTVAHRRDAVFGTMGVCQECSSSTRSS